MKVFVAIYEHRHGSDVRVFVAEEKAQAWKDEIGDDYWEIELDEPKPDGPCGDEYFDLAGEGGEYFNIEELEVE